MLGAVLDVFRLRQYFNAAARVREWGEGLVDDAGLVRDVRRGFVPLPTDRREAAAPPAFPSRRASPAVALRDRRVGVVATGGSGALASVVGVGRALEEVGVRPAALSVCSGSALFGFPLAAGVPAEEVARFCCGLRPEEYLDVDWPMLVRLGPTLGRGFAGLLRGDRLEATYRELLGGMTLGELPVPCYAPIWSIEHNRLEHLGPRTYPDLTVARAVRMAVALPLFYEPVELAGERWCDGGIVDIFPVRPVLDLAPRLDAVVGVNGFYPPRFAGEDVSGWESAPLSILTVASQVRTCQQVELARENLARLEAAVRTVMIEPVPYEEVRGVGFYRQFLSTRDWGRFMVAGRHEALLALRSLERAFTRGLSGFAGP
ncbi:MAG: patatin-like phospholipase family protein [Acidimicrobiales bacterium]|nr:patatin-like phospholipase family protein [Acidimicrobiales bacterium]